MAFQNATYCPQLRLNNYCYCISEVKLKYPQYCDVECRKIDDNRPLDSSRCDCLDFFAGPRCERQVCHYTPSKYYEEQYYNLFCLDGYNGTDPDWRSVRVENCSEVPNLNGRTARNFPACPCLNNGYRDAKLANTRGDVTCQCVKGYSGDLCQIEPPVFHRPSPVPTIGVMAFLAAVFFAIGLALYYRKRQNLKRYAQMYNLEPVVDNTKKKSVIFFAPRSNTPEIEVPSESPKPGSAGARNNRRGTLALFAGRHGSKNSLFGKKKPKQPPAVGPTLFEGMEEQSSQQPGGASFDDSVAAPQFQSSGTGMGM